MSTACTTSMRYFACWLWGDRLARTPFAGPAHLWAVLTVTTLLGLVWAYRRHEARVEAGEAPLTPGKVELILLVVLSVMGAGVIGYAAWSKQPLLDPAWMLTVTLAIGAWTAMAFVVW